jgi:guanylate kinase
MKCPIIVVAAPSGAGKSSFIERIIKEEPRLVDTVTYTTRPMRQGESQGHPYYFVTNEEFQEKQASGFFVEWAKVHSNHYGTPLHQLEEAWKQSKTIIMDVDIQGFETFKRIYPQTQSIFILPPSLGELRRRVLKRDKNPPSDFEVRMKNAEIEIARANEFDFRVINDEFSSSFGEFKKIIEKILSEG